MTGPSFGQTYYGQPGSGQPGYGSRPSYPGAPYGAQTPYYPPAYGQRPPSASPYGAPPPQTYGPSYGQPPPAYGATTRPAPQPPQQPAYPSSFPDTQNLNAYSDLIEQANAQIEAGQLSKAIDLLERARPLAPSSSLPAVVNNLAALYIKRGNYFNNTAKQFDKALKDFRMADFLLSAGWPEGVPKKPMHEENRQIARGNLQSAYQNMKIDPKDPAVHLDMAKKLRVSGAFGEALSEYNQVLELKPGHPEALRAVAELFNVMNQPEKSVKYFKNLTEIQSVATNPESMSDVYSQYGTVQSKTGDAEGAVASFNKALELNPSNGMALSQLEGIWNREIRFNPSNAVAHANLAGIYQKQKKYPQAQQQYQAAEYFANQNAGTPIDVKKLIRLNAGTLYQAMGNNQMAMEAYKSVLQIDPGHTEALFNMATLYETNNQLSDAQDMYLRVLTKEPENDKAHQGVLALFQKNQNKDQVAAALKAYAMRFPYNPRIQSKVGELFHQNNRYDEAITYYQKAISLDPNMAAAYANLGAAYQAKGQSADALVAFNKAQSLDPKNATIANLTKTVKESAGEDAFRKAVEKQQAGQNEESLHYFEEALRISPTNPDILAAHGVALQTLKRYDQAIAQYNKAIAANPNQAEYHYYVGTAYHQQNKVDPALASYKKALALNSGYAEAQQAIALIEQDKAHTSLTQAQTLYEQKQYPKALLAADQALKLDPRNATAMYYRGLILDAQKRTSDAITAYRKTVELDTKFTDAYYALGVALETVNKSSEAKQAFQTYVEQTATAPEDDFIRYAKERISVIP
jgi:tetratricopeptide (TPR) repeat protein